MTDSEPPQIPPDDKGLYTYTWDVNRKEWQKSDILIGNETKVPRTSKPFIIGGKINFNSGGTGESRSDQ